MSEVPSIVDLTFRSRGHRYLAGRAATRSIDRVPQGKNGRRPLGRRNLDGQDTMPEQHPYIFRIPTALSWEDAQTRLLARADGLAPGGALDARLFVDTQLIAREPIQSPADVHQVAREVSSMTEFPSEWDEPGGGLRMRGALDIREIRADGTPSARTPFEEFAEHRSADELARFLHHIHWIPQSRGLTDAFVDEHFPGRTWQGLVMVLKAAGIFVGRGGSPPRLMPTVTMLHFSDATRWAVEWSDGVVTSTSRAR